MDSSENQARFEALAQGQEADRKLLLSLSANSTPAPAPISILKMTLQDDPEAFVELFKGGVAEKGLGHPTAAPAHRGSPTCHPTAPHSIAA
ncbi:hypothetical protein SRHO_G00103570 [Serrasalmus rhombeus]